MLGSGIGEVTPELQVFQDWPNGYTQKGCWEPRFLPWEKGNKKYEMGGGKEELQYRLELEESVSMSLLLTKGFLASSTERSAIMPK